MGKTDDDRERWIKDCVEEFLETNWEKFDDDNSGDIDPIESYNLMRELDPKTALDIVGYKVVFESKDQDGDGALDKREFTDFCMDLIMEDQPVTKEMLYKQMHENLRNEINEKYTSPPQFFKGEEEERQ